MKVLVLDTIYPGALNKIFSEVDISAANYPEIVSVIEGFGFGTSGVYSALLPSLGVDCVELSCNSLLFNLAWKKEFKQHNTIPLALAGSLQKNIWISRLLRLFKVFESYVLEQIDFEKPDVVHCMDIHFFSADFFSTLKDRSIRLVGQIAAPMDNLNAKLKYFDCILSSFPHYVDQFNKNGVHAEFLPLAFDRRALRFSDAVKADINFSFVGGLGKHHQDWLGFLSDLNSQVEISLYGYGKNNLRRFPSLYHRHGGEVWGGEMYRTLARSRISLNRHLKHSKNFANNMRLFEVTGMGSLLLTDYKSNIGEMFRVNSEILVYSSVEEAVDLVKFFLDNPEEAESIARAGQQRTLSEHCYDHRMPELKQIYDCLFK